MNFYKINVLSNALQKKVFHFLNTILTSHTIYCGNELISIFVRINNLSKVSSGNQTTSHRIETVFPSPNDSGSMETFATIYRSETDSSFVIPSELAYHLGKLKKSNLKVALYALDSSSFCISILEFNDAPRSSAAMRSVCMSSVRTDFTTSCRMPRSRRSSPRRSHRAGR